MKLLIDIPEHIYEHAKEGSEDSRDEFEAMRAIANGSQQRTGRWIGEAVLDKIRAEIDRQQKWLFQAGYTAHNVDIAFDAVKHYVKDYINSQQKEVEE